MLDRFKLAIEETKLANQRTYLAYMRSGFVIAAISGVFKKMWILLFGVFMIIFSSFQYYIINYYLDQGKHLDTKHLHYYPLLYVLLSLGVLYLEFFK